MHRLQATRPQHIQAISAAAVTAVQGHVGADHEFADGERTDATHAMGERKRIRVTQQADVRLVAAQNGEVTQHDAVIHGRVTVTCSLSTFTFTTTGMALFRCTVTAKE